MWGTVVFCGVAVFGARAEAGTAFVGADKEEGEKGGDGEEGTEEGEGG